MDIIKDSYVSFDSKKSNENKFNNVFKNLENSTKVFKNTEKILKRLNRNKNWIKGQYNLLEQLFFEETNYVSKILIKLTKNLNKKRFKQEINNNLYIFKENFKIFIDIIINDFFKEFSDNIFSEEKEIKIDIKNFQNIKNLKFDTMESIQEVNEELISEKSVKNKNSGKLSNENISKNKVEKKNIQSMSKLKISRIKKNLGASSKEIKKLNISSEIKKDKKSKKYKNKSLSKIKNITPSNYITNFIYLNYGHNKKIRCKKLKVRKHSKSFKTTNSIKNNKFKEGKIKSFKV